MNISAVTSTPKSVTTAVDQTLTCTIGDLDGKAVTVTWKDPSDKPVSAGDTTNYALDPGTVDGTGKQDAVLTVRTNKLSSFTTSFTYQCSVTSSQYPGSPSSNEVAVKANILTLGKSSLFI